jgi:hypothetical protein
MGRQPNYEPFIVPVAAIPEIDSHKNFDSYSSRGTGRKACFYESNRQGLNFLA